MSFLLVLTTFYKEICKTIRTNFMKEHKAYEDKKMQHIYSKS